jgi:hypothetical protein
MLYVIDMAVDTTDITPICKPVQEFFIFEFSDKFHFVNSRLYTLPPFTNIRKHLHELMGLEI